MPKWNLINQKYGYGKNEKLSINNFGKGVALDVEVKWEVKIDEIKQSYKSDLV
jgi:hypothetical protein